MQYLLLAVLIAALHGQIEASHIKLHLKTFGEHSAVTGSPTANDANLSAEKTYETSTKANLGQAVTDSSSTDQHRSAAEKPTTDKPVEKTNETDKK